MLNIIKLESMSKRQSLEIPVRFENFCSQLIVQFLRKVLGYITSRYDTLEPNNKKAKQSYTNIIKLESLFV